MRRDLKDWQASEPQLAVTLLGELGSWAYEDPRGDLFGVRNRGDSVLAASADGRTLYFLRPQSDAGPVRRDARALHAGNVQLFERFQHRRADGYYNVFTPPFRRPRLVGSLAIVRYLTAKGNEGLVEWEHYFEEPGRQPAYAEIYSVGNNQFWIPPGPFRVHEDGIDYAP